MDRIRRVLIFLVAFAIAAVYSSAQTTTKIIDHGPDGEKLTFAVLGDGYAAADQAKYKDDVDRLIVNGVFGQDFYKDSLSAFNVYRVDLVSNDSGVSTLTFAKDTALKVIFSGDWNRCWLEESDATDQLITQAASRINKYDYVLVMANESGYGGCRRGSRLYITSGDTWDVVAHEYGHGIGDLFDEYAASSEQYAGDPINVRNCSTVPPTSALAKVVWKDLIDPVTPLPSDNSPGIDPNQTVGMFTGCNCSLAGIYRPVDDCRMKTTARVFCPVCLAAMKSAVAPYLGPSTLFPTSSAKGVPAPQRLGTYMNLVLRVSKSGPAKVLKATEVKGSVIPRKQANPAYFFAITKNNKLSSAEILPEDPFLVRGFIDPAHKERGEKLIHAESATIIVNVPNTGIAATPSLGLKLYSIMLNTDGSSPEINFRNTKSLKLEMLEQEGIKKEIDLPKETFGQSVAEKAEHARD
jgi:hypothetical protein